MYVGDFIKKGLYNVEGCSFSEAVGDWCELQKDIIIHKTFSRSPCVYERPAHSLASLVKPDIHK